MAASDPGPGMRRMDDSDPDLDLNLNERPASLPQLNLMTDMDTPPGQDPSKMTCNIDGLMVLGDTWNIVSVGNKKCYRFRY